MVLDGGRDAGDDVVVWGVWSVARPESAVVVDRLWAAVMLKGFWAGFGWGRPGVRGERVTGSGGDDSGAMAAVVEGGGGEESRLAGLGG